MILFVGRCEKCRKGHALEGEYNQENAKIDGHRFFVHRIKNVLETCTICACGGNVILTEVVGKISQHVCDAKCTNATRHICECACGGKNHGRGNLAA